MSLQFSGAFGPNRVLLRAARRPLVSAKDLRTVGFHWRKASAMQQTLSSGAMGSGILHEKWEVNLNETKRHYDTTIVTSSMSDTKENIIRKPPTRLIEAIAFSRYQYQGTKFKILKVKNDAYSQWRTTHQPNHV